MAIEQSIWRLGDQPERLKPTATTDEYVFEDTVTKDIAILNPDWLLIGRQVRTRFDKSIDLLAMDSDGSIIIVEVKRSMTPQELLAQAIDNASWVRTLGAEDIAEIYRDFADQYARPFERIDDAFQATFGSDLTTEMINISHRMVIVATEYDAGTERIVSYLHNIAQISINALLVNVFDDNERQYLSRAWMMDPENSAAHEFGRRNKKRAWNGEYYVSFRGDRPWEDARRLGFIAAGGDAWYSNTLHMLSPGSCIWVNIPGEGYVGAGIVTGQRTRADQHQFDTPEGPKSLQQIALMEPYEHPDPHADDEHAEYLVPVDWIHTVPRSQAFKEVGLFKNQNTVCKPKTAKWPYTINRLREMWSASDAEQPNQSHMESLAFNNTESEVNG